MQVEFEWSKQEGGKKHANSLFYTNNKVDMFMHGVICGRRWFGEGGGKKIAQLEKLHLFCLPGNTFGSTAHLEWEVKETRNGRGGPEGNSDSLDNMTP